MSTQIKYEIFKELVLTRNEFKHTLSNDGYGFSFSLSILSETEVFGNIKDENTWIKLTTENWETKVLKYWDKIYNTLEKNCPKLYSEITIINRTKSIDSII